ncbi:TTN [Mytilus edulis]|uniref:TTN n=1 Tax=Mytilus edulis TaxID=6550 RepID=A0A8S3T7J7_MYTED|nr:TTN [Mytilus edulis]
MTRWIHSRNGKFIREMNIDFVDQDTNTLHFPFCNHDDSGEYTCTLSTDYSLLPSINIYAHLSVNGPPIVLNQHTEEHGDDLFLSVMFYSIPYEFNIQWLLGNNSLNGDSQYTIAVNNMTVGLKQYNVDITTPGFISNLTIHNFKRRSSDVYSCQISNAYGLVVEQIVLGSGSWIHSNGGQTIRSLLGKHINNSNILTIPFCNSQDTGDYTCRWKTDILGKTLMEKSTTLSVSEKNKFLISTTEATTSSDSTGNSVTVIIAICSSVFGIAIVVICITVVIRRISSKKTDRYDSTMPIRDEDSTYDSTYDTISMSTRSNRPEDQADYLEVF